MKPFEAKACVYDFLIVTWDMIKMTEEESYKEKNRRVLLGD